MSFHDSPNLSLTADDIAAFVALLRLQGDISPTTGSLTKARLLDFMQGLTQFPYQHYSKISNAQLKDWSDHLWDIPGEAFWLHQTSYGCPVFGLYVAYTYYLFNECCNFVNPDSQNDCQSGYPPDWQTPPGGIPFSYPIPPGDSPFPWGAFCRLWRSPGQPQILVESINALMGLRWSGQPPWGSNPPTNVIQAQMYSFEDLRNFQLAVFDPAHWTDAQVSTDFASQVWGQAQLQILAKLQDPFFWGKTLQPDTCPFLLYLLTALGTSTVVGPQGRPAQQVVNTIVNTPAASIEYPNNTLIDQLIYHNLMYWADPMGSYVWNNAQLQSTLQVLSDAISSTDPASQAIVTALTRHLKILTADVAYPMQDPYNPNIGFNVRKTDTLAAINRAWSSLGSVGNG